MSSSLWRTDIGQHKDMVLRQDTASYSKSLKVQDSQLHVAQNFSSLRVKPGIPVPVMLLPVPDPTRKMSTRPVPDPGRVRLNPRVRIYPQTPSIHATT